MAGLPSGHRFKALAFGVGQLIVLVPLMATWLEASLGLTQGPALYSLIWAVPTLLAYRELERHLLLDP